MSSSMMFFNQILKARRWSFLLLAGLAGIANAGILVVINAAAEDAGKSEQSMFHIIQFAIAIVLFAVAQERIMVAATRRVEAAIHEMRMQLIERIRDAEIWDFERIGTGDIFGSVWKETQVISQAAAPLVIAVQGAILLIFCAAYIAWLSPPSLMVIAGLTAIGGLIYLARASRVRDQLRQSLQTENRLQERLSDFLEGFRELKFSRAKSADVVEGIWDLSDKVRDQRADTQKYISKDFIVSQITFYLITGAVVFVVPLFSVTFPEVVVKTSTASLFMIGPVSNVVTAIPILINVQASIDNIRSLETRLSEIESTDLDEGHFGSFETVEANRVCFTHYDQSGERAFELGPVDFTLKKGELVFISGGNGSGKTTFMQIFTGLRRPTSGFVAINGSQITDHNRQSFRALFNVIYSDLHLFRILYGLKDTDRGQVTSLLEWFELQDRVTYKDGAYSSINLSAGQRKRLALITAILEKKPLLVLDEWAADQDPVFRRKFYTEILPELRSQGFTILAISHDDMYYGCADRVIAMADGRIVSEA